MDGTHMLALLFIFSGLAVLAVGIWVGRQDSVLDHDGNGQRGGSLPSAMRGLDHLFEEYKRLYGRRADRRWGAKRLRAAIAAKQIGAGRK